MIYSYSSYFKRKTWFVVRTIAPATPERTEVGAPNLTYCVRSIGRDRTSFFCYIKWGESSARPSNNYQKLGSKTPSL
ncbi:MAG: hypothetical protein HC849_09650 [Oscillatoriales cyanobacterium RU_3_3]|nr:hypothetical protein [Oscillatoriales cyanobacterium RU_3_3]NJR23022.1 hypothetical protein [Richelia sp. CSU_2_1]